MDLDFTVKPEDDGKRIIDILRETYGMSSLLAKKIRLHGYLYVNGLSRRMIDVAFAGEVIHTGLYAENTSEPLHPPSRAGVKILYSDKYIIVASKPGDMVIHPVASHMEETLTHIYSDFTLHPVGRLDRFTSGIILMARDPYSHHILSRQMWAGTFKREYRGICHGLFNENIGETGFIAAPIGKRPDTRMLRRVTPDGNTALTEYETLMVFPDAYYSYMKFMLHTGKTHQIRVHSLYNGTPLLGDKLYGPDSNENAHYSPSIPLGVDLPGQMLHAYSIEFNHPISGERMSFHEDIPDNMKKVLDILIKSSQK